MHIYIYIHKYMYVYICICMYVCMCVYVCMYVYIYIYNIVVLLTNIMNIYIYILHTETWAIPSGLQRASWGRDKPWFWYRRLSLSTFNESRGTSHVLLEVAVVDILMFNQVLTTLSWHRGPPHCGERSDHLESILSASRTKQNLWIPHQQPLDFAQQVSWRGRLSHFSARFSNPRSVHEKTRGVVAEAKANLSASQDLWRRCLSLVQIPRGGWKH